MSDLSRTEIDKIMAKIKKDKELKLQKEASASPDKKGILKVPETPSVDKSARKGKSLTVSQRMSVPSFATKPNRT